MSFRGVLLGAVVVIGGLVLSTGEASAQDSERSASEAGAPQEAAASQEAAMVASDYVLGPGDVVQAQVLGRSDFNVRARIASDGTVEVPYLGPVVAANKTGPELGAAMAKSLEGGGYFSHPIVSVDVVSYASRYVVVLGAVGKPGLVPIDRAYRLSEILARVGGVTETGADYVVIRPQNAPETRVNLRDVATGDSASDPAVAAGEKIYVPPADLFYISGQVKAPGAYPVTSGMTLRMAIARGGGLTDDGTDRGVRVTRKGGQPAQPGLDADIAPGDVIVVRERLF